jgi:hypothetical protein
MPFLAPLVSSLILPPLVTALLAPLTRALRPLRRFLTLIRLLPPAIIIVMTMIIPFLVATRTPVITRIRIPVSARAIPARIAVIITRRRRNHPYCHQRYHHQPASPLPPTAFRFSAIFLKRSLHRHQKCQSSYSKTSHRFQAPRLNRPLPHRIYSPLVRIRLSPPYPLR